MLSLCTSENSLHFFYCVTMHILLKIAIRHPDFNFVSRVDKPHPFNISSYIICSYLCWKLSTELAPECQLSLLSPGSIKLDIVLQMWELNAGEESLPFTCWLHRYECLTMCCWLSFPQRHTNVHQGSWPFSAKVFSIQITANISCCCILSYMQDFTLPLLKFMSFLSAPGWRLWGAFLRVTLLCSIFMSPLVWSHLPSSWGCIPSIILVARVYDKYHAPSIDICLALMCSIMWFKFWKVLTGRFVFLFTFLDIYITLESG